MKGITSTAHVGERIIPAADNAALMLGETIQLVASWDDEPPSKRELLEQILAEQRKTNELLAKVFGDQVLRAESAAALKRILDESVEHAVKVVARANSQSQTQHERTRQVSPLAPNH